MVKSETTFLLAFCLVLVSNADINEYLREREKILDAESDLFLGGNLQLNQQEQLVNKLLMEAKNDEFDNSLSDQNFAPAMHFFHSKPIMLQSSVFQLIRKMPKGAVLHAHDISITPIDFLIYDASYRADLYFCASFDGSDPVQFQFSPTKPSDLTKCNWRLVSSERSRVGSVTFDNWLRSLFSMYRKNPYEAYPNINVAWSAFEDTLIAASGIINYAPVFFDYFYQGLKFFYDDNVQYAEIRTTLPQVYFLNGTLMDEIQVTELYQQVFDKFKRDHQDFSGAKIIFAPLRRTDNDTIARYVSLASRLKAKYPNVVAGFDLVGQEDLGPPLKEFLNQLLEGQSDPDLHYFLHAGETDWEGTDMDENVIDAILLNSTRIGHGFAIAKHPVLRQLAKMKGIPVEICPISNQVLSLVSDLRNHPGAILFAEDFPLVISCDDPASWDAVGLSSDFYMAFMGLAGRRADLRTLKQLAVNSIMYSAMSASEKADAFTSWQSRWDHFIMDIYERYQTLNNLV